MSFRISEAAGKIIDGSFSEVRMNVWIKTGFNFVSFSSKLNEFDIREYGYN